MSLLIQQLPDLTNSTKFELARRLAEDVDAPREALESVFQDVMQSLEKKVGENFDEFLKQRVWEKVSPQRLHSLKEFFLQVFCVKVLGSFKENQAVEMLQEYNATGVLSHDIYSPYIQAAIQLNYQAIIQPIIVKAQSMTKDWVPVITDAVKEEGIVL